MSNTTATSLGDLTTTLHQLIVVLGVSIGVGIASKVSQYIQLKNMPDHVAKLAVASAKGSSPAASPAASS